LWSTSAHKIPTTAHRIPIAVNTLINVTFVVNNAIYSMKKKDALHQELYYGTLIKKPITEHRNKSTNTH